MALTLTPHEPNFPWHLVSLVIDLGSDREFSEVSVDIFLKPSGRLLHTNQLFVVPLQGEICKSDFYLGVSSQDYPAGERGKTHLERVRSPGFAFTQFGQESSSILRPEKGSDVLVSNHEGPLSGLRAPGKFATGHYTFRLTAGKPELDSKGVKGFWVTYTVEDNTLNERHELGAIFFRGVSPVLSRHLYSFVELCTAWDSENRRWYHGLERPYLDNIPDCSVYVGNIRIDTKRIVPEQVDIHWEQPSKILAKGVPLAANQDCHLYCVPSALKNPDTVKLSVSNSLTRIEKTRQRTIFPTK